MYLFQVELEEAVDDIVRQFRRLGLKNSLPIFAMVNPDSKSGDDDVIIYEASMKPEDVRRFIDRALENEKRDTAK